MAEGGYDEFEMKDFEKPDDLDEDDPADVLGNIAGSSLEGTVQETNIDTGLIERDREVIEGRLKEFLPNVSNNFRKELAKDAILHNSVIKIKSQDRGGNVVYVTVTYKTGHKFLGRASIESRKGGPSLLARINKEEVKYFAGQLHQPLEPVIIDGQKQREEINLLEHFINDSIIAIERGETMSLEELPNMTETGTITDMDGREIEGLNKTFTTLRENISLATAKLETVTKNLAKAEKNLVEAKQSGNVRDIERWEIEVNRFHDEKEAARESLNILQGQFKGQSARLKDLLLTVRDKNIPLAERIRILFREEGITIASIVTAIGMVISSIALGIRNALTPSYSPAPPGPSPHGKSFGDMAKDALNRFKNWLLDLASKSASAIPGLIGSVVSFILKSIGQLVGFVAEHLIILVIAFAALIFEIIMHEINKKRSSYQRL
jgi:hypothetical protein